MEKIRIGLCGIGRAGWGMHIGEVALYPDDFEFKGACDTVPERMEAMEKRFPGCKAYPKFEDMINSPEIDLVVVAPPSKFHVEYAVKALEAGKYVLIEKPIGLNVEEAKVLAEADKKYKGKLFCRHNRRFEEHFQFVKEIIDSGVLGRVYEIKLCRHSYSRRNDWQTLKSCGGGQLNNWGPHLIDQALQYLDYEVESLWADLQLVAATGDAEDHIKAVFRGKSGRVVDIEISGGVAYGMPICTVYGQYGSIQVIEEKKLKIKRLDLEKCSAPVPATEAVPPIKLGDYGADASKRDAKADRTVFDNVGGLVWIEETLDCTPANGATLNDTYKHIAAAIKQGVPFPIKFEEAFAVVEYTEKIRQLAK